MTAHGTITTEIEYRHGELTFSIEDTGRGFTEEQIAQVSDHFSHNKDSMTVGSGLDMSIVQLLVKQMGGEIDIQSEYGKGTSVWVSIPCHASVIEKKRELSN